MNNKTIRVLGATAGILSAASLIVKEVETLLKAIHEHEEKDEKTSKDSKK